MAFESPFNRTIPHTSWKVFLFPTHYLVMMIKQKFPLAALPLVANSYVTMPATSFIGHWNTFHALWPISISCTGGFAFLLSYHVWLISSKYLFGICKHLWCLKLHANFGAWRTFCCVGSPGIFITPGTYHVLNYFLCNNFDKLFGFKSKIWIKKWF